MPRLTSNVNVAETHVQLLKAKINALKMKQKLLGKLREFLGSTNQTGHILYVLYHEAIASWIMPGVTARNNASYIGRWQTTSGLA